jgi:hypothetical protein
MTGNMVQIILGKFSEDILDDLLMESSQTSDTGARINFLSKQFLNIPYKEATLIGDNTTPEEFMINLEGVDCFTFLDYVEAMRTSKSFSDFKENLRKVRYHSGEVTFEKRNHFFTDWKEHNSDLVIDVTERVAEGNSKRVKKNLNEKDDGTHFIEGVECVKGEIMYVPSEVIDDEIIANLRTGDYLGIYSQKPGLDVSHVGVFINNEGSVCLRHASSKHGKVVDEDLKDYIIDKPGIIVLRTNQ